jgi:D-alanyl-D-alanine carboxypeptidase/D-alanyl-D-alanine-endopeptidase (penicillin-binding protein 4)
MANQIFLETGAHRLGGPVSLEKSVAVAREMLAAHDLADAIRVEEGSGLSRGNRFTARGLAKVLDLFAPNLSLLESRNGTAYKTGTLEGVRTLAGYASTSGHGPIRFVISLKGNNGAKRFELLKAIESEL